MSELTIRNEESVKASEFVGSQSPFLNLSVHDAVSVAESRVRLSVQKPHTAEAVSLRYLLAQLWKGWQAEVRQPNLSAVYYSSRIPNPTTFLREPSRKDFNSFQLPLSFADRPRISIPGISLSQEGGSL